MIEKWKSVFDPETGKVMLAAGSSLGASFLVIDAAIKIVIGILTVIYLTLKIRQIRRNHSEDDELD